MLFLVSTSAHFFFISCLAVFVLCQIAHDSLLVNSEIKFIVIVIRLECTVCVDANRGNGGVGVSQAKRSLGVAISAEQVLHSIDWK